jgi:hypothetical protein
MAKDNYTWVAPVGSVWRDIRDTTNINLYQTDGSHPSYGGTHLAALTIYQTLFQKKINENCFVGSLNQTNHNQIKNTATSVFNDSISNWNHDTCKVPTQFKYTVLQTLVGDSFMIGLEATTKDPRGDYNWYINKGSHFNQGFSIPSFTIKNNCTIYLKVKNACGTDSFSQKFSFVSTDKIKKLKSVSTYHTNVGKELSIKNNGKRIENITVCDINAKIVDYKKATGAISEFKYQVPDLESGLYYLFINNTLEIKLLID